MFNEILKDENGFYSINSFANCISQNKVKNYKYARYFFNKQYNPMPDVKQILIENSAKIQYNAKNRRKFINPICAYFVACIVLKSDIRKSIEFYEDILKNGIYANDKEISAFKGYLDIGRKNLIDDYEILSLFLCALTLYRNKKIFTLDVNKKYFEYFNYIKNKTTNQRIYNLLITKDNFDLIQKYILKLN